MRLSSIRYAIHMMIMGPPGAGKGTISSRIVRDFGVEHLSSGNILQAEIANQSKYGKIAASFIKSGSLVPDDVTVELMMSQVQRIPLSKNWLLDGFPRNVPQASRLIERERLDAVINLDVPFATIQERLGGRWTHLPSGRVYNDGFNPPRIAGIDDVTGEALVQREDDKPETIERRQKIYQQETKPLLEFFSEKNLLRSYSGTRTDDMWPSIKMFIKSLITDELRRVDRIM